MTALQDERIYPLEVTTPPDRVQPEPTTETHAKMTLPR